MRRRSLLALLGTSVAAGCSSLAGSTPGSPTGSPTDTATGTPTPTESPSTTETETPDGDGDDEPGPRPEQGWSLVAFETLPRTVSLTDTGGRTRDGGRVRMALTHTATADGPALLRGTFTNANDYANTFELRGLPLFRPVPSAWPGGRPRDDRYTYRDELVLAPTAGHDLARTIPDLARGDDGRWRLAGDIDGRWLPDRRRLDAGESFAFEYALVGRASGPSEGVGPFPTARYHFEGYGEREVVLGVWDTERPGPTDDSRFAGADPPPLPDADRMAWAHDAGPATPVYLDPSAERVEPPAIVDYRLRNHSREAASGNPYFWKLSKLVDGRWFHVAPWGWPVPAARVPPGDIAEWSLAAFHTHAIAAGDHPVGHLGGGRYAFEVGMARDDRTHAALLDIEAPPARPTPTDGLDVSREDGRVEVAWPRRSELERARLTLTRTDGTPESRLLAEQVMQRRNRGLRNTLAFIAGEPAVEEVVLVTDRNTVQFAARGGGYEDTSYRFRFRGTAFEARAAF